MRHIGAIEGRGQMTRRRDGMAGEEYKVKNVSANDYGNPREMKGTSYMEEGRTTGLWEDIL